MLFRSKEQKNIEYMQAVEADMRENIGLKYIRAIIESPLKYGNRNKASRQFFLFCHNYCICLCDGITPRGLWNKLNHSGFERISENHLIFFEASSII